MAVKKLKLIADLPETTATISPEKFKCSSDSGSTKTSSSFLPIAIEETNEFWCTNTCLGGAWMPNYLRRKQIIQGIAKGVKHLHEREGSSDNVIHRDLKPANVLLDGGWNAKVADFGTAKLLLAGATRTRTGIATHGMAPEYVQSEGGETTLKCDVCSFGVTLMGTLSGRRKCERPIKLRLRSKLNY